MESARLRWSIKRDGFNSKLFFLGNAADRAFNKVVAEKRSTIHTQEATLEQIFIKLTGRNYVMCGKLVNLFKLDLNGSCAMPLLGYGGNSGCNDPRVHFLIPESFREGKKEYI